jgi:hypothetical protein
LLLEVGGVRWNLLTKKNIIKNKEADVSPSS